MTAVSNEVCKLRVDAGASGMQTRLAAGFGRKALILGIFTSSFDIFLAVDAGGFTLRIHQILLFVATVSTLQLNYSQQTLRAPVGIAWLGIWVALMFAFIPNTTYIPRSLGYCLWLVLDVFIVLITVQLFGDRYWIEKLLRRYLQAFLVLACVGLLQLLLGFVRLPDPFVKQWIIAGVWPRLNGFSFEPSYYATYMLLGWVFSAWLLEKRVLLFGRTLTLATFATSTLAILFSTSRIGWAMMVIWGLGFALRRVSKRSAIRIPPTLVVGVLLGFGCVFAWLSLTSNKHLQNVVVIFAGGTGLAGTPAHSVDSREHNLQRTIAVFERSPFVGYSLGGVATAIGVMQGGRVKGNTDAKQTEGGSVFAEVLASSGLIGILPFILYMTSIIRGPLKLAGTLDPTTRVLLSGLVWALCMELLVLQFNQNILRPYLWFHIGVLSAAFAAIGVDGWRGIDEKQSLAH